MQTLLGLFLFSMFLATGASLQCETCQDIGWTCTGSMEICDAGKDACATLSSDSRAQGKTVHTTIKGCQPNTICGSKVNSDIQGISSSTIVTCDYPYDREVQHDKAPQSAASLFLALSGLLLMKILL